MNPVSQSERDSRRHPLALDLPLLGALYAFEFAVLLCIVGLYRLGDRALLDSLDTHPGAALVAGAAMALASIAFAALRARAAARRALAGTLALNLLGAALALGSAELAMHVLSVATAEGPVFFGLTLLPRSWQGVVERHRAILDRAAFGSFLAADSELGWTVAPSRESENGLYRSSAEGIRSAEVGIALRDVPARHRVALVGDSYTFCEEVAFDDCWSLHLGQILGPDVQVLNFGVPGYGIDQIYLRFVRDVLPWHPDIVVFGVFSHDFDRTMTIYNFISFPSWEFPFAKSRFVIEDGRLRNLNPHPLAPEAIIARSSIFDLPLLDHDAGFAVDDWRWRPFHVSYLARAVTTLLPPSRTLPPEVSEAAQQELNRALLDAFRREARQHSAEPLFVYLPNRQEMPDESNYDPGFSSPRDRLRTRGIPFVDLVPVVRQVPQPQRYLPIGRHYTGRTSREIAAFLAPTIRQILRNRSAAASEPSFASPAQPPMRP